MFLNLKKKSEPLYILVLISNDFIIFAVDKWKTPKKKPILDYRGLGARFLKTINDFIVMP